MKTEYKSIIFNVGKWFISNGGMDSAITVLKNVHLVRRVQGIALLVYKIMN